jgi:uncharacterized membrane protein
MLKHMGFDIEKHMDSYLMLKLVHILSAVVVAGTGIGIAFFMLMAYRSDNAQVIHITAKHVILGDWIFTTPAIVTLFVSGIMLMDSLGYSFVSVWFSSVLALFVFIGVCWLPVLTIQYRLRNLSELLLDSDLNSEKVSIEFKKLMRMWIVLGVFAFSAILIIFWLMVFKPLPVL